MTPLMLLPASTHAPARSHRCTAGYDEVGCFSCTSRFFRLQGRCEPCPDDAAMYFAIYAGLAVLLAAVAFLIHTRDVNLQALRIGIDFAQGERRRSTCAHSTTADPASLSIERLRFVFSQLASKSAHRIQPGGRRARRLRARRA